MTDRSDLGPTVEDLQAIEAEQPLLDAELAVVDAECRLLTSPGPLSDAAYLRAVQALAVANETHEDLNHKPMQGVS